MSCSSASDSGYQLRAAKQIQADCRFSPIARYDHTNAFVQRPANGSWNLQHQKFFEPAEITGWALVVYDSRSVREREAQDIATGLKAQADLLGMKYNTPH